MNKILRCMMSLAVALSFAVSAFAQVTTSSLGGKVVDEQGEPAIGAVIIAVHTPSGTTYSAVANADGRYAIQGMRPGGPYSVEVSSLGYQTMKYSDITLQLGETFALDSKMSTSTEFLDEVVVIGQATSKFSQEKTGSATNISNNQILELPTISRSITDVAKLSPYGGNGMSFAGSDGRMGNFTVDGANFNNNFGLSSNLPGGGSPISIDAIDEVQVVISPYDVRQSNFIGGGVNAITKSGTNTFKGSAYIYHRNEQMRGDTVEGEQILSARDKDRNTTFGFTLGGPIVKNKLFFFANFEYSKIPTIVNRWKPSENGVADADNYISRTTLADMKTVSDYLKDKYGYDTGSYTDFPAAESNMKILARLDWNISDKHHLAVRYNYTLNRGWNQTNGSSSDCGQRTTQSRLSQYSMAFANSLYSQDNKVNTISVDLNSRLSDNLSNQFLATFSQLDDIRGTGSAPFPFIDILDGTGTITPYMSVGYELFTWNNGVHNQSITAKDDLTYYAGNHKLTAGISYEYQMADNSYMRNGTGYYRYNSLEDFLNERTPETVNMTYGYDGELNPAARVRYHKPAIYAQDDWNITPQFKLTYGLRLETIIFDNQDVMRNQAIYDINDEVEGDPAIYAGYRIDTGKWPTTKIQVSPRIGFSWDVLGNKSLKVRGGTGLFTGRLPLVFFTNMPTNSGMVQYQSKITTTYSGGTANPDPLLEKFNGNMIVDMAELMKFLQDECGKPTSISPEDGVLPSAIQAVSPKFKMPQVWKTSLAIDYSFPTPFPMSIGVEGIFNKTINAVCLTDLNMKPVEGFARLNGPDNRHIYPADYTYSKTSAYLLTNTNKGYGWSASATFNIKPVQGLDITASYAHVASKELTGMPGSDANSAFTYIPTIEGPNYASLHNSQYVTPDRAFVNLTYTDKANNHFSLFYEAWKGGGNYSYMYSNDLNNDNYNYDVIYIPSAKDELKFKTPDDAERFWAFLENDSYLSSHKGQYAEGYSVYSPWVHRVDLRYAHDFKIKIGNSTNTLQLSFDLKNALNLFNSSWGVAKYMNPSLNDGRILKVEEIGADGVPVFSTPAAVSGATQTWTYSHSIGQCWYAQIGLKYMFN